MKLTNFVLAFVCFMCVYTTFSVSAYEHLDLHHVLSCNTTYLRQHANSAKHLQRLLEVYDEKFFNLPCSQVHKKEYASQRNAWDSVRPHPKIVVYIHIDMFSGIQTEASEEIFSALELSGLLKEASTIHVGVSGIGLFPPMPTKTRVVAVNTVDAGEYYTFAALGKYLDEHDGNNEVLLYLHSKGTSVPNSQNTRDRRRYQLYFNVWLYRWALIMLQHYDSIGTNLQREDSVASYSGNFWWAKMSYVKGLNRTLVGRKAISANAKSSEKWMSTGVHSDSDFARKLSCLINSGVNHDTSEFPVSSYTSWELYSELAKVVHSYRSSNSESEHMRPPGPAKCYVDYSKSSVCSA